MLRLVLTAVRRALKRALTPLTLIGLWAFFLRHTFSAGRSFALGPDNECFLGPVFHAMSTITSHGEWPLRMGTILGGVPLYNFSQLSSFYPLYLTALPIYGNPIETMSSMEWITLGHILIFEINMYIFLRIIGASRLAACTGSALVAFGANTFNYAFWVNIISAYSWFPLYIAGLIGILRTPQYMRYSAMALVGIVLLTLASPSQPLIDAVFITIIFASSYAISQSRAGTSRQILYAFWRLSAVAALAFLLAAPAILPVAWDFKDMIRWVGPFSPVVGNARIPFNAFLTDQLTIADLGGVLFPFKALGAIGSPFSGLLVMALSGIAIVSRPRSWVVAALAFTAIYSLISSTGSNLGLAYINYFIPLLNKIREPSRFLVLFEFAIGALATLGIDELRKPALGGTSQANGVRQALALTLTAIFALAIWAVERHRIISNILPLASIGILFVLAVMTRVIRQLLTRNTIVDSGTVIALAWSGAALILLTIEVPWVPPLRSTSLYLTSKALGLDTAIGAVAALDPNHEYRVIFGGAINKQRAAMLASYRGVRTLNAYFNPLPNRQFADMYYQGPRADNYFGILGAKYLICRGKCTASSLNGYIPIKSISGYEIYKTALALPQSYIVNRLNSGFVVFPESKLGRAHASFTKGLSFVAPHEIIGSVANSNALKEACISHEDLRTADHDRFIVHCNTSGILVLNEFFSRAWQISVDGVKAQRIRVNGSQIGVAFTAGSHIIDFRYLPRIFLYSLLLMLIGLVIVVLVGSFSINVWWKRMYGGVRFNGPSKIKL